MVKTSIPKRQSFSVKVYVIKITNEIKTFLHWEPELLLTKGAGRGFPGGNVTGRLIFH